MRGMFGLVGLLVTLAVIALIWAKIELPVAHEGHKAQEQAQQISGRGTDGVSAVNSFKVEPKQHGNELTGLTVTEVTAGGALDQYGLKKGDVIVQINGQDVSIFQDAETAKSLVHQAYQGNQPVVVQRGTERITLPPAGASSAGSTGATQQPKSIQDQIRIPTH